MPYRKIWAVLAWNVGRNPYPLKKHYHSTKEALSFNMTSVIPFDDYTIHTFKVTKVLLTHTYRTLVMYSHFFVWREMLLLKSVIITSPPGLITVFLNLLHLLLDLLNGYKKITTKIKVCLCWFIVVLLLPYWNICYDG